MCMYVYIVWCIVWLSRIFKCFRVMFLMLFLIPFLPTFLYFHPLFTPFLYFYWHFIAYCDFALPLWIRGRRPDTWHAQGAHLQGAASLSPRGSRRRVVQPAIAVAQVKGVQTGFSLHVALLSCFIITALRLALINHLCNAIGVFGANWIEFAWWMSI